jgi:hypothetical protein
VPKSSAVVDIAGKDVVDKVRWRLLEPTSPPKIPLFAFVAPLLLLLLL